MKTAEDLLKEAKKVVEEVTVDQAREIVQKNPGVVLIDVREPQELEEGFIPKAIHIPRGFLELKIEKVAADRNSEIILYCAGGSRSVLAAKSLKEMGYSKAKSMIGGFTVWEAAEYEIELPKKETQ